MTDNSNATSGVDITTTLAERGERYGSFGDHARIAQAIKRSMEDSRNYHELRDDMRQALEVIADKIARILNGDPYYHDNWHDICGYSKLVADTLIDTPKEADEPRQLQLDFTRRKSPYPNALEPLWLSNVQADLFAPIRSIIPDEYFAYTEDGRVVRYDSSGYPGY